MFDKYIETTKNDSNNTQNKKLEEGYIPGQDPDNVYHIFKLFSIINNSNYIKIFSNSQKSFIYFDYKAPQT